MSVKQTKRGKWLVDVNRKGIPRTRMVFDVKKDAEIYEREYLAKHTVKQKLSTDRRTLKELAELWHRYHGINLADGERRRSHLLDLAAALGNPVACEMSPELFVQYRFERLQAGISQKTLNNSHGYLSSMFNKMRKLKVIAYENPLAEVDFIKIHERQLSYLSIEQISALLEEIKSRCKNQSTWYVAHLCLRTGARWGEAEQLRFKQLHNYRVTYEFTKSKKTRTIPLDPHFYKDLLKWAGHKNPDDRIFTNCIGAFRRAVDRTDLELPKGQMTHILRHSFASHFIMNGGNILTLQKILGHADIKMTMRYAHLAPDHLNDAVKLNPVVDLGSISE
jgi:integrase